MVGSEHDSMTSICLAPKYFGVDASVVEDGHKTETVGRGRRTLSRWARPSFYTSSTKSFTQNKNSRLCLSIDD